MSNKQHIKSLDGLRGLAVLLVFLGHSQFALNPLTKDSSFWKILHKVCQFGVSGVDLFFVLSGFLITGLLLASRNTSGYFKNFYARRALRIFPLYFAVLILALIVGRFFFGEAITVRYFGPVEMQPWLWLYGSNIAETLKRDSRLFCVPKSAPVPLVQRR